MKPRDVDYDDGLHVGYDDGQSLPEHTTGLLLDTFTRCAAARRPLRVLDLGSGTGRFTPALADRFGGPVLGIEPSAQMVTKAVVRRPHPRVRYVRGTAECLPLAANSVDLILLFLVFHHITDPLRALTNMARVLDADGQLLICGNFADRDSPRAWGRYFPKAHDIEEQALPSLGDTEKVAMEAGLRMTDLVTLDLVIAPSLTAYLNRLRHRAVSAFRHLTELEVSHGLNALESDVYQEYTPVPVVSTVDLLVLKRRV